MLSKEQIKASTLSKFYERGRLLYRAGHVKSMTRQSFGESLGLRPADQIKGDVIGSTGDRYHATLFVRDDKILSYGCTCPAADQYPYPCKHCVALAFSYRASCQMGGDREVSSRDRSTDRHQRDVSSSPAVKALIYRYSMQDKAGYLQSEITGKVELLPFFSKDYGQWMVEFKIGFGKKFYVLKDIEEFVRAVKEKEKVSYGKNLEFIHEAGAFTPRARAIYEVLRRSLEERSASDSGQSYGWYRSSKKMRSMILTDEKLADLFAILWPAPCACEGGRSELRFIEGEPRPEIRLTENGEGGYKLELPEIKMIGNGSESFLISQCDVYRCSEAFRNSMEILCRTANTGRYDQTLRIGEQDMRAFCSSVLPQIQEFANIEGMEIAEIFQPETCRIHFYLDREEGRLSCRIQSCYGERQACNPMEEIAVSDLYRDIAEEEKAVRTAADYFTDREDGLLWMDEEDEERMYLLFSEGIRRMEERGEVFLSQKVNRLSIKPVPAMGVQIGVENGFLNLIVDAGNMPREEMDELLRAYRLKKKYYRLKSGDFVQLENSALETVSELADGLGLSGKALQSGCAGIPRYRSFYIDQVLKSCGGGLTVSRSSAYKTLIRNIKAVEDSDYEVPAPLQHILREYQKVGYRWLMTLRDLGFGGILADDMGLGKSLQILTFLCAAKEEGNRRSQKRTSLLVCPASLVYNWQEEAEKFSQGLDLLLVTGNAGERREKLRRSGEYDLLVTSYDLLKRDEEEYSGKWFYCQVLDEAQHIKNHNTKAAKAAKSVKAQYRFALTGTPIENRLSELWSIFDYLMPGILGSYAGFRRIYEAPIAQAGDEQIVGRLRRMTGPFILRRLKEDVLKDLPEKNEAIVFSKMEQEQESLYKANAQKLADSIAGKDSAEFRSGKMEILAGLTRMRQLCCDPHLVYENYEGQAAKLESCMELLENAIEGGKKILLFSQFTTMLDRIGKELKEKTIPFYLLTGATAKKQRLNMVHQFNEGDVPVFLISLKAGGTGLNLTGASVVIHYDPWWNLAAENQASDRAHRIGQEKQVTVYKLIMKNTIEEQIQKLQASKARLADDMISGQTASLSELTREDFAELLRV